MCGIFGIAGLSESFGQVKLRQSIDFLFREAYSRGKDAAGLAYLDREGCVRIEKAPMPAVKFVRTREYRSVFDSLGARVAVFGHSRLVTNGSLEDNENNQPVVYRRIIGIHNGIIANDNEIWVKNPDLSRNYDVDTEALFALLDKRIFDEQRPMRNAVESALNDIEGNASIAFFAGTDNLVLTSNNGSLYYVPSRSGKAHCFASERHMVSDYIRSQSIEDFFDERAIRQIEPYSCVVIGLSDMKSEYCGLARTASTRKRGNSVKNVSSRELKETSFRTSEESRLARMEESFDDTFARTIRRCTRCLLPSTFPFIKFDSEGVCNYCARHKPPMLLGKAKLEEYLAPFRSGNPRKPDCIAAVSGGRDSIYGIHYLKKEMGMNPIAYTYDWGMVTDIARRNIARVTGELGIEHVLVSADIRKKRSYIRKNLEAWLHRPNLGMIPILMAGDKKFKYYGMSLQKANGVDLAVYCAGNRFEKTGFKTGFCGVDDDDKSATLSLSVLNAIKLFGFYGKEYLFNQRYMNSSMLDTAGAYYYSYIMPKTYIYLYHYIDWDEQDILSILTSQYNWEGAEDTVATWRIGDGTACFYNYLYYRVAGFTEFDTFRSNQIREGRMDRQAAMDLVLKENRPRFRAMKTYLDLVGMDFQRVMKIVDNIPRLYEQG